MADADQFRRGRPNRLEAARPGLDRARRKLAEAIARIKALEEGTDDAVPT